jgi:hypothetical protein
LHSAILLNRLLWLACMHGGKVTVEDLQHDINSRLWYKTANALHF